MGAVVCDGAKLRWTCNDGYDPTATVTSTVAGKVITWVG